MSHNLFSILELIAPASLLPSNSHCRPSIYTTSNTFPSPDAIQKLSPLLVTGTWKLPQDALHFGHMDVERVGNEGHRHATGT